MSLQSILGGQLLSVSVASQDALDVRQFSVEERMSSLFTVSLTAVSRNENIDFDAVVGQPASFTVRTGLGERAWRGLVSHFQHSGVSGGEEGLSTYQLVIVPTLWLATQRKNYRMFQQVSELDIVVKMLREDWGIDPDLRLSSKYKKRKYRVQYGESDYAFIRRMLEDAGICFYFEDKDGETKLVLADAPQTNEPRAPLLFRDKPAETGVPFVTDVQVAQKVRPGKYTMRDHDYRLAPSYKLSKSFTLKNVDVEEKLERYQYTPGAFLFGAEKGEDTPSADDRGKTRTDEREGEAIAQKRLEAKRGAAKLLTFDTNAHELSPGTVMSMFDHPRSDLAPTKRWLVLASHLSGTPSGRWSHTCEASSTAVPYRPPLVTAKPKVIGCESATVVGPKGEEIHTDEFGRVRVHFHWDRESEMNDKSSCWIHVSQPWGGAGFGGMNLPRIGQEVLVEFLGGDPDRPIIVGRVYTNLQKVPYKLPASKTQSGWKSESSPGGGGFNELRFEDAKGSEQVYMQAEKDLQKLVKNNEDVTIGNNRTKTVGGNDLLTVMKNRMKTILQNETQTVVLNQKLSVGINRSTQVGAIDSTMVGNTHVVTIVPPGEGGGESTSITMSDKTIILDTGAGAKITLEKSTVKIEADDICLCAKEHIGATSQKKMRLVGMTEAALGSMQGDVLVQGAPSVKVSVLVEQKTPIEVKEEIEKRIARLKEAGLNPDNTSVYDALAAINTTVGNPSNLATIRDMADRYGIPPQLLAGVVASEMDFDHGRTDKWLDGLGRRGIGVSDGPGITSVHGTTLDEAIDYLGNNSLPGAAEAKSYDKSVMNRSSFTGAVEAGAIATAMYAHAKGGVNSADDMAVTWGAYRTGVAEVPPGGNGYTLDGYKKNQAQGTDSLPSELKMGTNAYMSQPLFEYFDFFFSSFPKDSCCA